MENNKENQWLYEEFGIKVDNRYICVQRKDGVYRSRTIIGKILNFVAGKTVVIKSDDGLYIIPYKEIMELRPLPIKDERSFKVGDIVRIAEDIYGYGLTSHITDKIKVDKGFIFMIAQIQEDIVTKKPVINLYGSTEYLMISLYNPKLEVLKRGLIYE